MNLTPWRRLIGAVVLMGVILGASSAAAGAEPALASASATPSDRATVIVVVGASGESEFEPNFATQASQWEKVCAQAGCRRITLGLPENGGAAGPTDRERLQQALAAEEKQGAGELWIVLIGHGTYDGKEAKFNLRGPDVAATELAGWLKPFQRPLAVIDTASASTGIGRRNGAFAATCSRSRR